MIRGRNSDFSISLIMYSQYFLFRPLHRVRPIPGMSRYTDTDTRYRYLYGKNRYESVSVRYGGYWGYRYRYWYGDFPNRNGIIPIPISPISPIPIPILGVCFIQIPIPGIGIGISAHTGYRLNSTVENCKCHDNSQY